MARTDELPERTTNACGVCGHVNLEALFVREMHIGLRETFEYGHCERCGAVTRLSVVCDPARYYPPSYYAFVQKPPQGKESRLKARLRDKRDRMLLTGDKDSISLALEWMSKVDATRLLKLIGRCGVSPSSRILDIGCGSGGLLHRMAELGFEHLTGVDPFAPTELTGRFAGLTILKGEAIQLEGQAFDLIMMHHVLEHCPDQKAQLEAARVLLAPNGVLLLRQPVCDSEAFRRYQCNWFQIDPPRHVVIHSVKSMNLLSEKCGFRIRDVIWDSTDLQFWASEQCVMDVPLYSDTSYFVSPEKGLFSPSQINQWKREAALLNRRGSGDQAAFFLEADVRVKHFR